MLPNLATLCISKPPNDVSDIGVRLNDLPGPILSKVLKDTGTRARSLCAAVDALRQTSKGFNNTEAWESIAGEYDMPDTPTHPRPQPQPNGTVQAWRAFVLGWCDDIRVGAPEADDSGRRFTYTEIALNREMYDGNEKGYAWLLKHGGPVGAEWEREQCIENVTSVKNVKILRLQLSKFTDGRLATFELLDTLFKQAIRSTVADSLQDSIDCMHYVYIKWVDTMEAELAAIMKTDEAAGINWGEEAMEAQITAALNEIKARAYTDVATKFQSSVAAVADPAALAAPAAGTVDEFMQKAITAMELNFAPSVDAIENFLINTLSNRHFLTANWFFARHKELIRQNMSIIDNVAQKFAGIVFEMADSAKGDDDDDANKNQRARVAAWRAELQSAGGPS